MVKRPCITHTQQELEGGRVYSNKVCWAGNCMAVPVSFLSFFLCLCSTKTIERIERSYKCVQMPFC